MPIKSKGMYLPRETVPRYLPDGYLGIDDDAVWNIIQEDIPRIVIGSNGHVDRFITPRK